MTDQTANTDTTARIEVTMSTYDRGQEVRRRVLGDAYVDASARSRDSFNSALQDLVVEYCWGTIWTREGLDRRTRSLVNIGMLAAMNRSHELKLHVRGAVNNGCSAEEIAEVILQAAIYCGVPAALEASRVAREVLGETGETG